MYLFKKFKSQEFEISSATTWKHDWTLGIAIHLNWITRKDNPELDENGFFLDIHILCFEFTFNYWWDQNN